MRFEPLAVDDESAPRSVAPNVGERGAIAARHRAWRVGRGKAEPGRPSRRLPQLLLGKLPYSRSYMVIVNLP